MANARGGFGPAALAGDATSIEAINAETTREGKLYNLAGMQVSDDYKGIVRRNITRVESEDGERWECSEVQTKADMTQEQAEAQADAIWQAEAPSGVDIETLAVAVEELAAIIAEL